MQTNNKRDKENGNKLLFSSDCFT